VALIVFSFFCFLVSCPFIRWSTVAGGMTVQNEPEYAAAWEACVYTAEEQRDFVRDYLGPVMRKQHPKLNLIIYDHNKVGAWQRTSGFAGLQLSGTDALGSKSSNSGDVLTVSPLCLRAHCVRATGPRCRMGRHDLFGQGSS
jgi:hypothetical protein